jgi:SAM-dependent methyltransferase
MTRWATPVRAGLRLIGLEATARRTYYRLRDLSRSVKVLLIDNPRVRRERTPDGIPLPPVRLVYLVQGSYYLRDFYARGLAAAESIRSILKANGVELVAGQRVLDFGCGCGRVIRHWQGRELELHGSDYNGRLVGFCQRAMPFAHFSVNGLRTTLPYSGATFDLVYALSVFTHFDDDTENFWLGELSRVVKPGGYLYITVQGARRLHAMTPGERRSFERGERVSVNADRAGSNDCYAYHPEAFVRRHFGRALTVVDFVPGGQTDNGQDVCLLRTPSRPRVRS